MSQQPDNSQMKFWPAAAAPSSSAAAPSSASTTSKKKVNNKKTKKKKKEIKAGAAHSTDYSRFDAVDDSGSEEDRRASAPSLAKKLAAPMSSKRKPGEKKPGEADVLRELGSQLSGLSVTEAASAMAAVRAELAQAQAEVDAAQAESQLAQSRQSRITDELAAVQQSAADAKKKAEQASTSLDHEALAKEFKEEQEQLEVVEEVEEADDDYYEGATLKLQRASFEEGRAVVHFEVMLPKKREESRSWMVSLHAVTSDGAVEAESLAEDYWEDTASVSLEESAAACAEARRGGEAKWSLARKCKTPTICAARLNLGDKVVATAEETVRIDWLRKQVLVNSKTGVVFVKSAVVVELMPGIKCFSVTTSDKGCIAVTPGEGVPLMLPCETSEEPMLREASDHDSVRVPFTRQISAPEWRIAASIEEQNRDRLLSSEIVECGFCCSPLLLPSVTKRLAPMGELENLGECADSLGLSPSELRTAAVPEPGVATLSGGLALALHIDDFRQKPELGAVVFAPEALRLQAAGRKARVLSCARCRATLGFGFGVPACEHVALLAHRLQAAGHDDAASAYVAHCVLREYRTKHALLFEINSSIVIRVLSADGSIAKIEDLSSLLPHRLRPFLKLSYYYSSCSSATKIDLDPEELESLRRQLDLNAKLFPPSLAFAKKETLSALFL